MAPDNSDNFQLILSEHLALLSRLTQEFTATHDPNELLEQVIGEVIEATCAERGVVMLVEPALDLTQPEPPEPPNITAYTSYGLVIENWKALDDQISRSVIEQVARKGVPVITSDALQDERFKNQHSVVLNQLRSILCVPMSVQMRVIGVIYVDNRYHTGMFSQLDLELLSAIGSTAASAIENARLYAEAVENGRIERELQMARHVQTSMLPQQLPELPGWDFAAQWLPAHQIGGDYYDFIPLEPLPGNPDRLGLVIADATDKGAPAALFMANVRSTVRALCSSTPSPLQGIQRANRLICADSYLSMFITMFYGQVNPQTGELIYINAGHNPPLLCSCSTKANGSQPFYLQASGIPLGIDAQTMYEQQSVTLEHGDFMVCYTDGIIDALNPSEEAFGMDRLLAVIAKADPTCCAAEILEILQLTLLDFIGDREQFDDITILVARRL